MQTTLEATSNISFVSQRVQYSSSLGPRNLREFSYV
jgi:hypothetical protein